MHLNWSQAYAATKSGDLWGFIDLSSTFTDDTKAKYSAFQPNNGSNINLYLDSTSEFDLYFKNIN